MTHTIAYGNNIISFTTERRDRKSIQISVYPDLSVKVLAPKSISNEKLNERIRKRSHWIKKHLDYFKALPPKMPPREYVSGETFMYLGRQYRLKVMQNDKRGVKLKNGYLILNVTNGSDFREKKELVLGWYKDRANKRYTQDLEKALERLNKHDIGRPNLKIKTLRSRWGSCSAKTNTITLNIELIKAPSHCIEYVVVHELCHLKHNKHNKRFYNFLSSVMPDWKERKKRLERVII